MVNGMKKNRIIAVDFDGTLTEENYPNIGQPNLKLIYELISCRKNGDKIILWTCRDSKELEDAINWCKQNGLEFDAINDNIPEVIEAWQSNPRKIYADVYIDDKNKSVEKW